MRTCICPLFKPCCTFVEADGLRRAEEDRLADSVALITHVADAERPGSSASRFDLLFIVGTVHRRAMSLARPHAVPACNKMP